MKLSDIKGERAIGVLADLIDPIVSITKDEEFKKAIQTDKMEGIKYLLKHHSTTVIIILAVLNEEDPETYQPSLLEIPVMLLDFFNDPTVIELFGLQDQIMEKTSSGPVMENTEAPEA